MMATVVALNAPAARPPVRTIEIERIVVPSIPVVEARQQFLGDLRWKRSRLSGRHVKPSTADKYRNWLLAGERLLDLGVLTEEDIRDFQGDVLD